MGKKSAGILLYRFRNDEPEFFLAHPGGPFFKNKDLGIWTIPKGEFNDDEDPLQAALREFTEETGHSVTGSQFIELTPIRQKNGKLVLAWALESDLEFSEINSNKFKIEWPPRSGKFQEFPEIDRAEWFSLKEAGEKIYPNQLALIEELLKKLAK